jgi:hypothetical protein
LVSSSTAADNHKQLQDISNGHPHARRSAAKRAPMTPGTTPAFAVLLARSNLLGGTLRERTFALHLQPELG